MQGSSMSPTPMPRARAATGPALGAASIHPAILSRPRAVMAGASSPPFQNGRREHGEADDQRDGPGQETEDRSKPRRPDDGRDPEPGREVADEDPERVRGADGQHAPPRPRDRERAQQQRQHRERARVDPVHEPGRRDGERRERAGMPPVAFAGVVSLPSRSRETRGSRCRPDRPAVRR